MTVDYFLLAMLATFMGELACLPGMLLMRPVIDKRAIENRRRGDLGAGPFLLWRSFSAKQFIAVAVLSAIVPAIVATVVSVVGTILLSSRG